MTPLSVLFYGSPDFAGVGLEALCNSPVYSVRAVVTQPDRPAGRGGQPTPPPVKRIALAHSIPVLQPENIRRDPSFSERVRAFGPFDVGVVIAFGQILPVDVLSIPRIGSINVHASILPRWRGAAPLQRALLAGDKETGVCLMQMEAGLDTGPVFSTTRVPISREETTGTLHDTLAKAGAELLVRDLQKIVRGEITATPQASDGVTYAAKITNAEAEINWARPSAEIERLIRGMAPSPGAFTFLRGSRLKIYGARAVASMGSSQGLLPGQVTLCSNRQLEIQTGDGVISCTEIQLEGKKRMNIVEFLKGAPLDTMTVLGASPL